MIAMKRADDIKAGSITPNSNDPMVLKRKLRDGSEGRKLVYRTKTGDLNNSL